MDRDEILKRARKENKNQDLVEEQVNALIYAVLLTAITVAGLITYVFQLLG